MHARPRPRGYGEAAFSKDDAADSQIYPPVVGTSPFYV